MIAKARQTEYGFNRDMRGNSQSSTVIVENSANGREFYIAQSVALNRTEHYTCANYGLKLLLIHKKLLTHAPEELILFHRT